MRISEQIVKHTAYLARLTLTSEEIVLYSHQLTSILNYIQKLRELDVNDVSPTYHVLELTNVFRDDEVKESLPVEKVLNNAPDRKDNFFKVPKVF
jgi:aspartyl-tRNA(Asn)/glutamyl-tRNA(Gln) amidotransferase subunit C